MKKIIDTIKKGGLAIIKTDTLYGIITSVHEKKAVAKVYRIKKRDPEKSMIVLASSIYQIETITGVLDQDLKEKLRKYWPGPYSIILPINGPSTIKYVHKSTKDIAFRIPNKNNLLQILEETGPVIAPSANQEGLPPAQNVIEAKAYFGDTIDVYVDEGDVNDVSPSQLIKILPDGNIEILR
jgi:L-threonylcarbamoyladenylate synthase